VSNFYDEWLATGPQIAEQFENVRMVSHDRDIPWVATRQDAKVKLMISNVLGFLTMGSNVLKAEIPVGWHTGKHTHGEESIHILQGTGFIVISGQRFEFHKSTTIQIPYRAEHQLFNTGDEPVQYISGMCFDLERFVQLAKIEQLEDCGPNDAAVLAAIPPETSQYFPNGFRAAIHLEDAPTNAGDDAAAKLASNQYQHDKTYHLVVPRNGFKDPLSVSVTHIFQEPAHHHSGRHKHLEAVLYVLEGEGFSEVGREEERWEAGDVLHVPPSFWEHEHYNDSDHSYRQLRIQFGIRFWFTDIWPEGYTAQRIYDEFGNPIIAGRIERVRERV
jgi:quercetin dioxygenase-like cupin family protein